MTDRHPQRRTVKYRALKIILWTGNRILVGALRHGLRLPAVALLETTGRRTRRLRHTPVGNGLVDDTFWLIAAHGKQADYIRNIAHDPHVRVLVGRRWRPGVATLLTDDDIAARSRAHPYPWDAAIGRALATTPLTVRIDLDPPSPGPC